MPDVSTMANSLLNTAKDTIDFYKKTGRVLITEDGANERLSTCESCVFFDRALYRCNKCGCFMKAKVYLEAAKCPINKWN